MFQPERIRVGDISAALVINIPEVLEVYMHIYRFIRIAHPATVAIILNSERIAINNGSNIRLNIFRSCYFNFVHSTLSKDYIDLAIQYQLIKAGKIAGDSGYRAGASKATGLFTG